MQTSAKNEILNSLLKELAIKDISELVRDTLATEILCKISGFSEEVEYFEERYGKSFSDFNTQYESGEENFQQYDDLMSWQFAQQGKEYWQTKLEEIKSVF